MPLKAYIKWIKHAYLWLAIGFVSYVAWKHSDDIEKAISSLSSLTIGLVLMCLVLAGASYLCRSFRWLKYMRLVEKKGSIGHHFTIYLSGFAFTASPAKIGELMRATYLNDLGIRFHYVCLSFVSERLLDVTIVFFLGSYFLFSYFDSAFIILASILFFVPLLVSPILRILCSTSFTYRWKHLIGEMATLWQAPLVLKCYALTLLAWVSQGLILFFLLKGFKTDISPVMAISIYCLSLLIGAASFIPSGIGVTEIGMIWLLNQIGVDNNIAIISSLTVRLLTLWPAMIIGLICALTLKHSKGS